eukprot:3590464-Rhodomonas_salina.2
MSDTPNRQNCLSALSMLSVKGSVEFAGGESPKGWSGNSSNRCDVTVSDSEKCHGLSPAESRAVNRRDESSPFELSNFKFKFKFCLPGYTRVHNFEIVDLFWALAVQVFKLRRLQARPGDFTSSSN